MGLAERPPEGAARAASARDAVAHRGRHAGVALLYARRELDVGLLVAGRVLLLRLGELLSDDEL